MPTSRLVQAQCGFFPGPRDHFWEAEPAWYFIRHLWLLVWGGEFTRLGTGKLNFLHFDSVLNHATSWGIYEAVKA